MKGLIITLLCVITWGGVAAQSHDSLTVRYKSNPGEFESQLLAFQGISYMSVEFSENIKPKEMELHEIVCRNGEFEEKDPFLLELADGETLRHSVKDIDNVCVMAQTISADSVKIMLEIVNGATLICPVKLSIGRSPILMETFDIGHGRMIGTDAISYPINQEVPLIAFSEGIPSSEIENFQSYCDLRAMGIHPRKWVDLGLKNYIYYTVRFK